MILFNCIKSVERPPPLDRLKAKAELKIRKNLRRLKKELRKLITRSFE